MNKTLRREALLPFGAGVCPGEDNSYTCTLFATTRLGAACADLVNGNLLIFGERLTGDASVPLAIEFSPGSVDDFELLSYENLDIFILIQKSSASVVRISTSGVAHWSGTASLIDTKQAGAGLALFDTASTTTIFLKDSFDTDTSVLTPTSTFIGLQGLSDFQASAEYSIGCIIDSTGNSYVVGDTKEATRGGVFHENAYSIAVTTPGCVFVHLKNMSIASSCLFLDGDDSILSEVTSNYLLRTKFAFDWTGTASHEARTIVAFKRAQTSLVYFLSATVGSTADENDAFILSFNSSAHALSLSAIIDPLYFQLGSSVLWLMDQETGKVSTVAASQGPFTEEDLLETVEAVVGVFDCGAIFQTTMSGVITDAPTPAPTAVPTLIDATNITASIASLYSSYMLNYLPLEIPEIASLVASAALTLAIVVWKQF